MLEKAKESVAERSSKQKAEQNEQRRSGQSKFRHMVGWPVLRNQIASRKLQV